MRQSGLFSTLRSRSTFGSCAFIACAMMLGTLCGTIAPGRAQTTMSQAPLAGTSIDNQANVTFDLNNQPVRLDSNTVSVLVQAQESLTLTTDNTQQTAPGASVDLPHRLTNTGNVTTNYTLTLANPSGNNFDLQNETLYRDVNGNGQYDLGEPQITPTTVITLAPGESVDLVIVGTTPSTALSGQTSHVQITATSGTQNISAVNTDTVQIASGVAVRVLKSAQPQQATVGQSITYTLTTTSYGSVAPSPISVIVDGASQNLIVLRDQIPANTVFQSLSDPGQGIRLYHRVGDPSDTYVSVPPTPATSIDAIGYGFTSLAGARSSSQLTMTVQVTQGGAEITNTAVLEYSTGTTTGTVLTPSNPTVVGLPTTPPVLTYYTDGTFTRIATATGVGQPLFLQATAGACNQDPTKIETITILIRSALTGDTLQVTATETGPNTGIFRTGPIPTNGNSADPNDGILQTRPDDVLTATMTDCNGATATTKIAVDPFGIVFDSRTNAPIAGATVTLIDVNGTSNGGHAGAPATVYQFDGVTPAPSTVVTGADGSFQFPQVAPGVYELKITPPAGYKFPSVVPPALLPPSRVIDASGSYGGTFTLGNGGSVQFDVPLDGPPPSGLFIEKVASVSTADLGDFVDYSISIRNNSGTYMSQVRLYDSLPHAFSLVPGSVRYNGTKEADPTGTPGPNLVFTLPNLTANQQITITYRVRIGVNAARGDNRNHAHWTGVTPIGTSSSNVASAIVTVQGGVFTSRGIIFGRVYVDTNHNRVLDNAEVGIPGVRIYLEDGTFAITDSEGKYSMYGLSATTHNVKLDITTLPKDAQLELLTNRNLDDAGSVLADLKSGEMHKANFAIVDPTDAMLKEIAERRKISAANLTEAEQGARTVLAPATDSATPTDGRSLPASGIIGSTSTANAPTLDIPGVSSPNAGSFNGTNFTSGLGGISAPGATGTSLNARGAIPSLDDSTTPARSALSGPLDGQASPPQSTTQSSDVAGALSEDKDTEIEDLLPTLTPDLGFIDLKDKDTLPSDQINIRVKGAASSKFVLKVNGESISESRVGTKSVLASKGVQAWEYIGVRLKSGNNTLELTQTDSFGNARGTQTITIVAPGDLGHLRVLVPLRNTPADGRSLVQIKVILTDDKGVKVTARTPITLESTAGQWQAVDLNPTEPGVQVFIEGGEATFNLLAPLQPGQVLVRATSGLLEDTERLVFVPELRPLLGSGVADVRVNLFGFTPKSAQSIPSSSLFDDDLQSLSGNFNSKTSVDGRAALFLKGQILGKYLLTLRYDSQQDSGARLFRDIQPDEYYPVYGDSSVKGFDAQSTSRLYVRVDRNQSYILYGDYTTTSLDQLNSLSRYSRALNGFQVHHETERSSFTAYQAHDNSRQEVTELRGLGIAGPYSLGNFDVRLQSETVEIIVRDRNQPSVILSTTPQIRFQDYEIDSLSNGLIFNHPIPSTDADLNPVFVRITYEVDTGGPKFNTYGVTGQFKVTKNLQIGGSYNRADDPQQPATVMGLSAVARLSADTILIGEWARTDRTGSSSTGLDTTSGLFSGQHSGSGYRLELLHNSAKFQARLFAGHTTKGFDNPESTLTQGRSELSASGTYQLSKQTRLLGEAIQTKDDTTGQKLTGAQLSVETALNKTFRLQGGVRYSSGNTDAVPDPVTGTTPASGTGTLANDNRSFTSLFARVTAQITPRASLFSRYEQELSGGQKSFALGGEYQLSNRTRLYAVHEFLDSLGGLYALNETQRSYNTRFGIESDYMKNGRVYSEYRIGDGIDGRSAEAAFGLRNLWNLGPGLRLNTSLERVRTVGGTSLTAGNNGDSTAAGVGIEYLAKENLKATARVEARTGQNTHGLLNSFGVAYKPGRDLTFLTRNLYTSTRTNGSPDRVQDRFQIGLAYRQTDIDKFSALLKYEYRYDLNNNYSTDTTLFPNTRRVVNIVSGDLNYQPAAATQFSLHYAWKKANDDSNGLSGSSNAQLLSGRVTRDLNRKFDLTLLGSTLWSRGAGGHQYGLGAELGYVLQRNMLLSVGYNIVGYRDPDLAEETFTKRGLYMRLRFKFDEHLFRGLEGKQPATIDNSLGFTPITAPGVAPVLVPGSGLFGAAPGQLNQNE